MMVVNWNRSQQTYQCVHCLYIKALLLLLLHHEKMISSTFLIAPPINLSKVTKIPVRLISCGIGNVGNIHNEEVLFKDIHQLFDVKEVDMQDQFSKSSFAETRCWSTQPLVMRGAFRTESDKLKGDMKHTQDQEVSSLPESLSLWPTWDEVMEIGLDDDAESRLITHVPDDPSSWRLTLGPFVEEEVRSLNKSSAIDECMSTLIEPDEKWTMVVNDIDRFHPPLFEFITENFSFIPQWRRDDGQISLSNQGGGIGPHTDDYDVFLIQMAGTRQWDIGRRIIPTPEELNGLRDGLDVRILDFWDDEVKSGNVDSFNVEPGDVIYLPPRFAHSGTALCDGCMTLSVGLRAPSAKELMIRMAEHVDLNIIEGDFIKRYTDPELLVGDSKNSNEISLETREKTRQLLSNAFLNLINNDSFFDEFFAKIATESNRARSNYPPCLDELDDDELKSLGDLSDADKCVNLMLDGEVTLFAAEGTAWAYSILKEQDQSCICRLFVDGTKWEIDCDSGNRLETDKVLKLLGFISETKEIDHDTISQYAPIPKAIQILLRNLVQKGYLYASSKH